MHDLGTTDANTCAYNDLALVKVDAADVGKVNPSIPFWGGPTGIDTNGTAAGDRVYTYGNSSLRAGVSLLSPHTGISLGDDAADGGWSHPLYTVTPGVPGDSGSAFVSADGKAIGVAVHARSGPAPAVEQHRRPQPRSWPSRRPTPGSAGSSWSTAPSPSTRSSEDPPLNDQPHVGSNGPTRRTNCPGPVHAPGRGLGHSGCRARFVTAT